MDYCFRMAGYRNERHVFGRNTDTGRHHSQSWALWFPAVARDSANVGSDGPNPSTEHIWHQNFATYREYRRCLSYTLFLCFIDTAGLSGSAKLCIVRVCHVWEQRWMETRWYFVVHWITYSDVSACWYVNVLGLPGANWLNAGFDGTVHLSEHSW